jgi:transglutaminase-like putative cysteine protease
VAFSACSNEIGDILPGGSGSSVKEDDSLPDRDIAPQVLANEASGKSTFKGSGAVVDYSNAAQGYIMVNYSGDNEKVKVRISLGDNEPYTYDLETRGEYVAFPLSQGSGSYTVGVFTLISGDKYAQAAQKSFDVEIEDQFEPFLRPNVYVQYTADSACVKKAQDELKGVKTDLGVVERLFLFVTENVTYDYDKAATVQSGYIPDPDETLSSGKGICFDFASLTTAMLRSQGIPCELVVGYAGTAYHAWISVYSKESGEVAKIIKFDGDKWTLMDPTFVAGGDKADPNLVGDGKSYNPLYYY